MDVGQGWTEAGRTVQTDEFQHWKEPVDTKAGQQGSPGMVAAQQHWGKVRLWQKHLPAAVSRLDRRIHSPTAGRRTLLMLGLLSTWFFTCLLPSLSAGRC